MASFSARRIPATYLDGELLKLISDRALSAELHGRAMGPEGSIAKLLWSETEQHVTELASDILGPDALQGPWARDRVYSRAQLLDRVWGGNVYVEERTVDVHIRRLRKALTPTLHDRFIRTVRGAGYRFSVGQS